MIPAYNGNRPYIFVSYAHKDSPLVFPIIEALSRRGYRIWYDEGIEPGTEWPEYIANHLMGAETVLAFLTKSSVDSVNCRREINFALSKNKPVLSLFMEKLQVPPGMELQLSAQQSILYYNYDSQDRFLDKIETSHALVPCRRGPGEEGPAFQAPPASAYVPKKAPKKISPYLLAGCAGALALLLAFFYLLGSDGKKNDAGNTAPSQENVTAQAEDGSEEEAEETPAPSETEEEAPKSGSWNYRIERSSEDTAYSFERGPQILVPASWEGHITIMEEENSVVFYHTLSRDSWLGKGYDHTGYLFKLCLDPTQDYKNMPSFLDLGRTDEGYFFLVFPTDMQAYAENERIRNDYMDLLDDLSYVKEHSYMKQ